MERTEPHPAVVCDAGPLIHLDELDSIDLLLDFDQVLVPQSVWREVARHRPRALLPDILRQVVVEGEAPPALAALSRALVLDSGESEALQLALQQPETVLLTDDAAARLAAEALHVRVHGSIGVLLRAVRLGRRKPGQVIALMESLPERSSLHVRRTLIEEVIAALR